MIPPIVGDETSSPGERELFRRFREDSATEGWVVLHSLDVPNHRRQISGEIDFVVIVPELGALCLEVKAHHSVSRTADGLWVLGNDPPERRGPFRQAAEAMHSLRDRVVDIDRDLSGVPFWTAVCFTRVDFDVRSPAEWHDWQVIDARRLLARPISSLVISILTKAREHITSRVTSSWFHPSLHEPTPKQVERLVELLRPSFEFYESPKSRRRQRDDELLRYTTEQFADLDAMDSSVNPRVIFEGPAGTGKTLLALEESRRSALRGSRVLLCCFNRLLGAWLRGEAEPLHDRVKAGTFHSLLLEISGVGVPVGAPSSFWQDELPTLALDALLGGREELGQFDVLVLDEAQDLLRGTYLDVFDALLAGGMSAGVWRFFGDFEQQSIYGSTCQAAADFVETRAPGTPRYLLTKNCRNTPRIASFVSLLAGFRKGYGQVLRPDSGVEPEMLYYESDEDQRTKLTLLLDQLFREGFAGRDIVVLSPKAHGIAESVTAAPWRDRFKPATPSRTHGPGYCTVHSFKGLEAPVVVVTDVESIGTEADDSLFYVAVTRATDRLYVLASARLKPTVLDLLLAPSQQQGG
jgi:hypothetical protein